MSGPKTEETLELWLSRLIERDEAAADLLRRSMADGGAELPALLGLALRVRSALKPADPQPEFVRNSEVRLLNRLAGRTSRAQQRAGGPYSRHQSRPALRLAQALASLLVVAAIFLSSAGVVTAAAADALPGDRLYAVKRGWEQVRLALTPDTEAELQLLASFRDERIGEIEALAGADRLEDLDQAVDGYLQSLDKLEAAASADAGGGQPDPSAGQNIASLEAVQSSAPPQAQAAIQRAIDRAEEHAQQKAEQRREQVERRQDKRDDQALRRQEREAEQAQRRAEQLARKYDATAEQVLGIYYGACQQDWKCVHDYFDPK